MNIEYVRGLRDYFATLKPEQIDQRAGIFPVDSEREPCGSFELHSAIFNNSSKYHANWRQEFFSYDLGKLDNERNGLTEERLRDAYKIIGGPNDPFYPFIGADWGVPIVDVLDAVIRLQSELQNLSKEQQIEQYNYKLLKKLLPILQDACTKSFAIERLVREEIDYKVRLYSDTAGGQVHKIGQDLFTAKDTLLGYIAEPLEDEISRFVNEWIYERVPEEGETKLYLSLDEIPALKNLDEEVVDHYLDCVCEWLCTGTHLEIDAEE